VAIRYSFEYRVEGLKFVLIFVLIFVLMLVDLSAILLLWLLLVPYKVAALRGSFST
jgi:hypothetical protein